MGGSMSVRHNILIAVDDSGATDRALTYVASIIGTHRHFRAHLVHVAPILPKLLEFGGNENGQLEENREAEIAEARARYLEDLVQSAFAKARAILQHPGVAVGAVKTHVVSTISGEDVIRNLLEVAQTNTCDTIVVGRQSHSWLRELVQHHLADELIRKAAGFTMWVVE
jgi:nucleotide-binding universal stress UspA family protein